MKIWNKNELLRARLPFFKFYFQFTHSRMLGFSWSTKSWPVVHYCIGTRVWWETRLTHIYIHTHTQTHRHLYSIIHHANTFTSQVKPTSIRTDDSNKRKTLHSFFSMCAFVFFFLRILYKVDVILDPYICLNSTKATTKIRFILNLLIIGVSFVKV